jgi:TRAP transporter TAXI family solute receptor
LRVLARMRFTISVVLVRRWVIALLAVALTAAAGCGEDQRLPARTLTIATGTSGGVYDVYGRAIARAVTAYLPDLQASATSTHGSVENLKLLSSGRADVAFARSDSASAAARGGARIVALARLYDAYLQVIVRKDSAIRSIGQLSRCGRSRCRVEIGPAGSGTQLVAERVLSAAGLDGMVITQDGRDIAAAAAALESGKADAIFWAGGLPTPTISALATRVDVRFVDLGQVVAKLHRAYPDVYTQARLPRHTYGASTSASTVSVSNDLAVRADLPDDIAYALTAMLFRRRAELARAHPEARYLNVTTAIDTFPLRLHPGAERYYRDARP